MYMTVPTLINGQHYQRTWNVDYGVVSPQNSYAKVMVATQHIAAVPGLNA